MSDPPRWQFRRMQPGEMNIDPIEGEFFSTEALGSLADALRPSRIPSTPG